MLRIGIVARSLFARLVIDVSQVLQYIDKHHALLLDIGLVRVSDKVHIEAARSITTPFLVFALLTMIEWVFLVEVIKVLVANLAGDRGLVRGDLLANIVPVEIVEKWMRLDLFCTVATKADLRIGDKFVKNIS